MKQRGYRYYSTCGTKLQKRGLTAAGTQRWYCQTCSQSLVKPRPDLSRSFVFANFISWLLGKAAQTELSGSDRTFRDQTAWCWQVPAPSVLSGEVHYGLIIDGIRVGSQVCLVARTTDYVVAWHWAASESSVSWLELLSTLPPPHYIVCDGQKGMLKALALCWPDTIVQRCRFHVWLNVRKKLTLHPEARASQELLSLARKLLQVQTKRQARRWKRQLKHWYRKHRVFIAERSYKLDPKPRERTWRYTHERLRSAYRQLHKQTDDVLRSSYRPNPALPATTNYIEGGINSQIRTLLKYHRGMPNQHQKVLVNWYLYSRTEQPKPPRNCL